MENRKGLSAVVTTLIIILLVLVAVGIVWVVVNNIVEGGASTIDVNARCIEIDVRATAVNSCTSSSCGVTLERNAGGGEMAGVKLVFSNGTIETSSVIDQLLAMEELETTTVTVNPGMTNAPDKVEVTVYLQDDSGKEHICPITNPFSF